MTLPSVLLGFILSTLYGAGFHLWRGGGAGRLIAYLILGWIGFWVGNGIASLIGFNLGRIGSLNVFTASVASLVFLVVGHWLSLIEMEKKS